MAAVSIGDAFVIPATASNRRLLLCGQH